MSEKKSHLYALIVTGGTGSRLWPKSRPESPKQFINLFGKDNLFQKTVKRTEKVVPLAQIYFVAGRRYVSDILKSQPDIPPQNIICEPDKKHTAAAIALATAKIAHQDEEATIINLWSDHLIKNNENFQRDLLLAGEIAAQGENLVGLGIEPTFPHTGFGYIETGEKIREQVFTVKSFLEKPDLATAKKYLTAGSFYWNLGTYTWHNKLFWQQLEKHSPELFAQINQIRQTIGTKQEWSTTKMIYEQINPISIDRAIAEKTKKMLMVKATFDWHDVGDWQAVWEEGDKDESGNVVLGDNNQLFTIDCQDSLFHTHQKKIAAIGLKNFVVVDTPEAILICPQNKSQHVKQLAEKVPQDND